MTRIIRHKSKPEQAAASDPESSVWVSANAGSGKTRVLVDRIARLLLAGIAPDRLLCLTFTKAAAAEMKGRLFTELGQWVTMSDADLRQDLSNLLGSEDVPDSVLQIARRLFAQALETPGGLKVQTIHAFCEALLKRFPLEASLPPLFEVADERTGAELLRQALDRALVMLDGTQLAAFRRLAAKVSSDDLLKRILDHRSVRGRAKLAGINLVPGAAARALGLGNMTDAAELRAAIAEPPDRSALAGGIAELCASDKKTMKTLVTGLQKQINAAQIDPGDWADLFLTKAGTPRKNFPTGDISADLAGVLQAEQERVFELSIKSVAADLAEDTDALIVLGDRVLEIYEILKRERTMLDFEDLIGAARDLLTRADMAQWVLFKIDGGVDHILVDEAQDTSPSQWQIIGAIAEEFFAGESSRPENRTFFAVGDEKQSIYSFQGADPAAVAQTRALFKRRAQTALRAWQDPSLTTSFRSTGAILSFVDKVFEAPEAREGLIFDEAASVQHTAERHDAPGRVELWPACPTEMSEEDEIWTRSPDAAPARSGQVILADRIANTIRAWLEFGEMLPDGSEPIRPGHILILLRRRAPFMELLNRALKRVGVPVAGVDRMAPIDEMPVMDMMALAEFALQPLDDLTLATVLKGPLIGWDDDALMDLAIDRQDTLWAALQTRARTDAAAQKALDILGHVLARADRSPPFEFFMDLLDACGLRAAFHGQMGPEVDDPVDEFLNQAMAYERLGPPSLRGFLTWIGDSTAEIKRELDQSRNEVRLMTVHGAKGLESEIVILPDTAGLPSPGNLDDLLPVGDPPAFVWRGKKANEPQPVSTARQAAETEQLSEYRRLLYVALTRAKDRLIVCGALNISQSALGPEGEVKGPAENSWYDLVAKAMDALDAPFDDEVQVFQSGDRMAEPRDRDISVPSVLDIPAWARTQPGTEPAQIVPVSPSRMGEAEPGPGTSIGDGAAMRMRGNAVHKLLEVLPGQPPEQRADLARAILARSQWDIPQGEIEGLVGETLHVLTHPEFASIFAHGSYAEIAVAGPVTALGGRPMTGFIDRLLVTDDTILIVDYKTNRIPPETAENVSNQYVTQMALYRAALMEIYPGRDVQAALLWTCVPSLMTLPTEMMDNAVQRTNEIEPAS